MASVVRGAGMEVKASCGIKNYTDAKRMIEAGTTRIGASASIGMVIGALIGGPIWLAGGIHATSMVSATFNSLALISLWWGLRGWGKR